MGEGYHGEAGKVNKTGRFLAEMLDTDLISV
jgi:hypothetical protein